MSTAVLDRPVWRLADEPRSSAELIAEAVALLAGARTCCARLAGAEAALSGADLPLARRLIGQALDDLADVVRA